MPALGLAQPLGISVPITNAAANLPLLLRCNGNDITKYVDVRSYSLQDGGLSAPQQLSFDFMDKTKAADGLLQKQALIQWSDEVNNVMLYQGYIKDFTGVAQGPYAKWTVTCNDLSEALDFARPIIAVNLQGGSDQAQIQALLASYSLQPNLGSGGFVQVLNPSMPANNQIQMTTLRNGIEQILSLTGVPNAAYAVDPNGQLHTLTTG